MHDTGFLERGGCPGPGGGCLAKIRLGFREFWAKEGPIGHNCTRPISGLGGDGNLIKGGLVRRGWDRPLPIRGRRAIFISSSHCSCDSA
jgi:hypothetical protein